MYGRGCYQQINQNHVIDFDQIDQTREQIFFSETKVA